jgi:precorrin-8X/cobalt-precorrin-8 methylmutase
MPVTIKKIGPGEIEAESFRMIAEELGPHSFDDRTFKIVQRVIHATGDFSFAESLRFSPDALDRGITALQQGKNILTDVNMVATGISKPLLTRWNTRVICSIAAEKVRLAAQQQNSTRAETAIEQDMLENIGIVAIGNAPTALIKIVQMLATAAQSSCPLIIGVPVGFVNAAESKALLHETTLPHITSLGRKGGSPVAAAIVNALIRLAGESWQND